MAITEKRQSPRRNIRIPILSWEGDEEQNLHNGTELVCKDISAGGLAFWSTTIAPLGRTLSLEMYMPGRQDPISCKIKIVAITSQPKKKEYIIRSEFVEINSNDQEFIVDGLRQMNLYLLLDQVLQWSASDLHLTVGRSPMLRVNGRIKTININKIKKGQIEAMLYPLLNQDQIDHFEETKELDFAFSPTISTRFRVNMHWQKGFIEATLRNIPTTIQNFIELGLPEMNMGQFCAQNSGLILIAGTTGSGKTTTMSSMVDFINKNYEKVVITIEDPVEYTLQSEKSIVKQRELGTDTRSYAEALKRTLRQDPDVICVGELLDGEALLAAMRAAETGHLVISTIHAPDTIAALERAVNFFPPEHGLAIRQQLSSCLTGVLFQMLLPSTSGGRVLASELLIINAAMRNLIREGRYSQMINVLQTGRSLGMYTFQSSLHDLYTRGQISQEVMAEHIKRDR
ncbi:MAG: PilT/PilU family type 4a pilus ATPase [Candidatus Omnitrophica bacterium]|nr:PilT/PilU family type 4a pilus ATPase [Candidatus Omnitrophota bacterium]